MNKLCFKLLLILSFASPNLIFASGLTTPYPENGFSHTGVIDRIVFEKNIIVVSDRLYILPKDVIVHSPSSKGGKQHRLNIGSKIGYKQLTGSHNNKIINEIWILPKDYKQKYRITIYE
ncbi:hypothetical protein JYT96_02685 [Gammaproteobacteria bacterium AH-315-C21]|nr:hypothetical protein [Gammaproteobacteria bacterium AH-315-C21]